MRRYSNSSGGIPPFCLASKWHTSAAVRGWHSSTLLQRPCSSTTPRNWPRKTRVIRPWLWLHFCGQAERKRRSGGPHATSGKRRRIPDCSFPQLTRSSMPHGGVRGRRPGCCTKMLSKPSAPGSSRRTCFGRQTFCLRSCCQAG
jgi:hypothetical protein